MRLDIFESAWQKAGNLVRERTRPRTTVAPGESSGDEVADPERLRAWLRQHPVENGRLGESEARAWLGDQIPFGAARISRDPGLAVQHARAIGYPVVVKVLAPGLLHKTELGLVRVGLDSDVLVRAAADELWAQAAGLGLTDFQLSVQAELRGVEMAIGVRRDALGPVCMVAAGGTLIEMHNDAASALAPIGLEEAVQLVSRLRIARLLDGYRGSERVSVLALAGLLVRVSELAAGVPELLELDLNPVFVSPDGCLVADGSAVVDLSPPREESTQLADLSRMLAPKRIAVIGAGSDPSKAGRLIIRYLAKHKYPGEVIAVSSSVGQIDGAVTVPSLDQVAGEVDLACIAVRAEATPEVVAQCVRLGIPGGIVFSSGFAEAGEPGLELQRRLLAAADGRFRILGPNSMGMVAPGRGLFATFGMALEADHVTSGGVGFVSQSGALANSLFSRSAAAGIGFSHWISVGNEADLGVEDFVAHLADDDACRVICLFLEAIRRPAAFAAAAERVRASGKAMIVLKAGRSEAGRAAAASHTGALTGSDTSYTAFFERHGLIRVDDLEDLFMAAQGILMAGATPGHRAGIVSMSGGACSVVADACAAAGLEVPTLDAATQERLRAVVPSFGGVVNPVDVTAMGIWKPQMIKDTVRALLDSPSIDMVLVQLSTNADPAAVDMARDLIELRASSAKPILIGRLGSAEIAPRAVEAYRQADVHVFSWPEQLVTAAAASAAFGELSKETGPSRPSAPGEWPGGTATEGTSTS
jgi:acetate---CoA ligase (ADP-forming)